MASPKSAYGKYNVMVKGLSVLGSEIEREMGVAKFLKNTNGYNGYFNLTDIVGDDQSIAVNKIKLLFKLDRLGSVNAEGISGFIGQIECESDGTPKGLNATFHKDYTAEVDNRYSGLLNKVKDEFGIEKYYHYLNDAGLNRKGECYLTDTPALWSNYVRLVGRFESSMYNTSTAYGFNLNENSRNYTLLPQNRFVTETALFIENLNVNTGDNITVNTYITNSEGTWPSTQLSLQVEEPIWATTGTLSNGGTSGGGTIWYFGETDDNIDLPLTNDLLYNVNDQGQSLGYFTQAEFKNLQFLPNATFELPSLPTVDVIGYKTDRLYHDDSPFIDQHTNRFDKGYYYIANDPIESVGIPSYGTFQGTTGKVFYCNELGEFQYYKERTVQYPVLILTSSINQLNNTVTVTAGLYLAVNGEMQLMNHNPLGVDILLNFRMEWYGEITAGGHPSGPALYSQDGFSPLIMSLIIPKSQVISNMRITTINLDAIPTQSAQPGEPAPRWFIAAKVVYSSPDPSPITYTINTVADEYFVEPLN